MRQQPRIIIIAAVARNRVIGCGNGLPWHLPADLRHFKQATMGNSLIMGRKTWESLPGLLPHRTHIVVTRTSGYQATGGFVARDMKHALTFAGGEEVFVIGGAQIYALALPLADRMLITEVDAEVEGDALFPAYDAGQWQETAREAHAADSRNPINYSFVTLDRLISK